VRHIGLDVHRDFCEVAIAEHGKVRSAGRIRTTVEELELFAQSLGSDDHVGLETTGNALTIARLLEPFVARVVVADTQNLRARRIELVKDLVAMANSGGGVLVIGVRNNATLSGVDLDPVLNLALAEIVDKVARYTGEQSPGSASRSGRLPAVEAKGRDGRAFPTVWPSTPSYSCSSRGLAGASSPANSAARAWQPGDGSGTGGRPACGSACTALLERLNTVGGEHAMAISAPSRVRRRLRRRRW